MPERWRDRFSAPRARAIQPALRSGLVDLCQNSGLREQTAHSPKALQPRKENPQRLCNPPRPPWTITCKHFSTARPALPLNAASILLTLNLLDPIKLQPAQSAAVQKRCSPRPSASSTDKKAILRVSPRIKKEPFFATLRVTSRTNKDVLRDPPCPSVSSVDKKVFSAPRRVLRGSKSPSPRPRQSTKN